MRQKQTFTIAILLLLLFVTACQTAAAPTAIAVPQPTNTSTITATATTMATILPLTTRTPPTLTPTVLSVETVTSVPTAPTLESQKSIATQVSITTQPTFEPQEAANTLLDLLQNNGGCLLPCWWGATPGYTKWNEVDALFQSLDAQFYEPSSSFHEIFLPHVPTELFIQDPLGFHLSYSTQNGVIKDINIVNARVSDYYLASILTEYGLPEEVLISTMSWPRQGELPFQLVMIYRELGFAIKLYDNAEITDDMVIIACFSADEQQNPALYLWSTTDDMPPSSEMLEVAGFAGVGEGQYYLPLEDVTEMDIAIFYETYREENNNACLQTPADLWDF